MVIEMLLIKTLAAMASRFARLCGRSCWTDGNFLEIRRAVPRAFGMIEWRWYFIKWGNLISRLVLVSCIARIWMLSVWIRFLTAFTLKVRQLTLMVEMLMSVGLGSWLRFGGCERGMGAARWMGGPTCHPPKVQGGRGNMHVRLCGH